MKHILTKNYWVCLILYLIVESCTPIRYFGANLFNTSSYNRYVSSLKKAGLDKTSMGTDWITRGEQTLLDSNIVSLPFEEIAYFAANRIDAKSYQLDLSKGQQIEVEFRTTPRDLLLFVDLFQRREEEKTIFIPAQTPKDRLYRYTIINDGMYVLRVQPQMLTGGRYGIRIVEK